MIKIKNVAKVAFTFSRNNNLAEDLDMLNHHHLNSQNNNNNKNGHGDDMAEKAKRGRYYTSSTSTSSTSTRSTNTLTPQPKHRTTTKKRAHRWGRGAPQIFARRLFQFRKKGLRRRSGRQGLIGRSR